jgi:hypothetical protein
MMPIADIVHLATAIAIRAHPAQKTIFLVRSYITKRYFKVSPPQNGFSNLSGVRLLGFGGERRENCLGALATQGRKFLSS